ncbi:YoaK family protein [Streptomyces justiciae]|uniref:YoaK family protein n=1 Tax=Streptomyces justiciae TaxID=2780140 RepID=A0ABU3LS73_9ACTN|nr:YoaK family protein [Streptomyces justiciae]MDT7842071.1 YoaK family protein [Streptomyces justiciae]
MNCRTRSETDRLAPLLRSALVADPRHDWLPIPLLVLTLLSGVIDAVSLLGLGHVFVANMTGNVVLVGLALSGAPGHAPTGPLTALGGFVLGALLIRAVPPHRVNSRTLLALCAATESVLLALAAVSGGARSVQVLLCAVALGMQNAAVRRVGVPELTTTVMTGTLTGLIGSRAAERTAPGDLRRALSVLTLLAGAGLGALSVRLVGTQGTLLAEAVLAALVALSVSMRHSVLRRLITP